MYTIGNKEHSTILEAKPVNPKKEKYNKEIFKGSIKQNSRSFDKDVPYKKLAI